MVMSNLDAGETSEPGALALIGAFADAAEYPEALETALQSRAEQSTDPTLADVQD